jgi:ankyrin repeat protein
MEDSIAQSDSLLHEVSKATSLLTKTDSHIAMRKALMNAMATSGAECNPASAYRSLAAVVSDAEECGVECTEAHKHLAELKEAWRSDVLKNLQSALQSTKPAYLDAALWDAHALGFENEVTALVAQRRADLAPLARSLNEKLMSSINDPAQIQSLLGDSADPNFVNERGVSVLHLAVQRKRVDAITIILEAGADPNMSSKMGNTPLHAVAQLEADDDTFSIARLLIRARSEVNNESTDGWRPLHHAVVQTRQRCENRTVRMDIVSLLLTNKASVSKKLPDTTDARYAGAAPLHLATETGNEEAVSLLLTWKPKVDARNACGDTPLWLAVNRGDVSIVERLLEARADSTGVDQSSNTLLHQVALSGNGGLTELLVKYMADLNARNAQGLTPLAVARGHGRGVTALTVACELEQLGARS